MGIEITTRAEIAKRGWLGRRPGRDTLFAQIQKGILEFLPDPLFRKLLKFSTNVHTMNVEIPAGQLDITWEPTALKLSVKTSTAGPGFHKYVCDLIEHLQRTCDLDWDLREADEAAYLVNRNYASLCSEMTKFLKAMSGNLLEWATNGITDVAVAWPIDWPRPANEAFSVSMFGKFSKEWWQGLSTAQGEELAAKAEEFFPWWRPEMDARFWKNMALVLLWSEVPWHARPNDSELRASELAIACCERAREIDPDLPLPDAELAELKSLLATQEYQAPVPEGIGFHRRLMTFDIGGQWTVVLPGYYYQAVEGEHDTAVFWFGEKVLRATSLSASGKKAVNAEALVKKAPPDPDVIVSSLPHLKGWAKTELTEEEGKQYWILKGTWPAKTTSASPRSATTIRKTRTGPSASSRASRIPTPTHSEHYLLGGASGSS